MQRGQSHHSQQSHRSQHPKQKLQRSDQRRALSLWSAINYHRQKLRYVDNWPPLEEMEPWRRRLALLVRNSLFDGFMMAVILANLVLVVMDTDLRANGDSSDVIVAVSSALLFVYVLEIVCRVGVDQKAYFSKLFNWMDCTIVFADVLLLFVQAVNYPSISTLRILRAIRLLRIVRLVRGLRELWLMMHGMFAAMKAMSWAVLLIMIALLLFSIVSVDLLHPLTKSLADDNAFPTLCTRCDRAFSSVFAAFWSWFLLIFAQQLWSDMASIMVDEYPATAIFYLLVFFTINLGVLNLMLTVIVDLAEEARSQDERQTLLDKKNAYEKARSRLLRVCIEMDEDQSGFLSAEEIFNGYSNNSDFEQVLQVMDVGPEDLQMVFEILDDEETGLIGYEDFVERLYKMKTQESHTLLVFIHHHLNTLKKKVSSFEEDVAVQISRLRGSIPGSESRTLRYEEGHLEAAPEDDHMMSSGVVAANAAVNSVSAASGITAVRKKNTSWSEFGERLRRGDKSRNITTDDGTGSKEGYSSELRSANMPVKKASGGSTGIKSTGTSSAHSMQLDNGGGTHLGTTKIPSLRSPRTHRAPLTPDSLVFPTPAPYSSQDHLKDFDLSVKSDASEHHARGRRHAPEPLSLASEEDIWRPASQAYDTWTQHVLKAIQEVTERLEKQQEQILLRLDRHSLHQNVGDIGSLAVIKEEAHHSFIDEF